MDPDLPLLEALQAGDESALDVLIERHERPLFCFVYRYLQNEATAKDVVQETFVRVFFKAAQFKPRSSVKTWIYTIAVNLCRDHGRRFGKRRWDVSLNARASDDSPPIEIADSSVGPDEEAGRADHFEALRQAIDRLPENLRTALVLFALEGHPQNEVAAMLGTTPKTIELRVAHAKQKLRKMLSGEWDETEPLAGTR